MILGTGMDLVEIARIEQMIERFGPRFIHRILRPPEAAYCQAQARPGPHIAARFAAKEAVSKALAPVLDGTWHGTISRSAGWKPANRRCNSTAGVASCGTGVRPSACTSV